MSQEKVESLNQTLDIGPAEISTILEEKGDIDPKTQPIPKAKDLNEGGISGSFDPLKPKVTLQLRFGQATNGATHRNCEESRKTPEEREEIKQKQIKKYGRPPKVVAIEMADLLSLEPDIIPTTEEQSTTEDTSGNRVPTDESLISTQQYPIRHQPPRIGRAMPVDQFWATLDEGDAAGDEGNPIRQEILEILAEEQERITARFSIAPHLLESARPPRNPYAPRDIIEEDLSEDSRP